MGAQPDVSLRRALGDRAALGVEGLVESGRLSPEASPRAIDLGCGSGANTMFLAEKGWSDVTGVEFSATTLQKAQRESVRRGLDVRWIRGDLTRAYGPPGHEGSYDLLVDYGTLDDLHGAPRVAMARLVTRLAAPGARFLLWCFYARYEDLPHISFDGASKMSRAVEPGEEEDLFGADWEIERLPEPPIGERAACFLMEKR